jgi:phosphohistidine phosphatase
MPRLYFLRHGLADRSEWSGDDFSRPLTARGKQEMRRIAETIASLQLNLELILSSPLARAYQTAEIVAEVLGLQDRLVSDDRLAPGFGLDALRAILAERPTLTTLMLVGHEPDFSDTISALIGGGRIVCKKGGLARVDLPDGGGLEGELVWLAPPALLRA